MLSLSDAVRRIHAAGLPVLFADTCILLDVIRAPLRPAVLRGCVEAARELHQLVTSSPARCTLVAPSFVPREWLAHSPSEAEKLSAHLAEFDDESERLRDDLGLMGITPAFPRPEYRRLPLVERLHDLSRQLLGSSLQLEADQGCILRAYGRATSHAPPSCKGGEVKDSTIIEECLEACRRLHDAGFSPKRVFCTSNRNDYCEKGSSRLHAVLAADFESVGLEFAASLPQALSLIMRP